MDERIEKRKELGLTQSEAAVKAGVSLATWRRWEVDPESVGSKSRAACERALAGGPNLTSIPDDLVKAYTRAWGDSTRLTTRQAFAITVTLDSWADGELALWLDQPDEPLHDVGPFSDFDLRVLMLVAENRAWVQAVRQRCSAIPQEIQLGILPFDRPGAFIDEVLIGAALQDAPALMSDMPELFADFPARQGVEDEEDETYLLGDEDWHLVSDTFDDECRWDDWEIPMMPGNRLLPALLQNHHPFRWFDKPAADERIDPPDLADLLTSQQTA